MARNPVQKRYAEIDIFRGQVALNRSGNVTRTGSNLQQGKLLAAGFVSYAVKQMPSGASPAKPAVDMPQVNQGRGYFARRPQIVVQQLVNVFSPHPATGLIGSAATAEKASGCRSYVHSRANPEQVLCCSGVERNVSQVAGMINAYDNSTI
jgi:hypothetical protein